MIYKQKKEENGIREHWRETRYGSYMADVEVVDFIPSAMKYHWRKRT
jgi:hypothetical protein